MKPSKIARIVLALCCFAVVQSGAPAYASLTDTERRELAKSFVGRLKSLYKERPAPAPVASPSQGNAAPDRNTLTFIPDGQELLLRPNLGYQYQFADNVPALKEHGRVYISFPDFVDILYFAIDYDRDTQSAAGWFLREDWQFALDFPSRTVVSRGNSMVISESDVIVEDDKLLVASETLEQWFGIGIKPDLMSQSIKLESDYPFPAIAQNAREQRSARRHDTQNVPEYPVLETDYKWFDINSAQVSSSNTFRRRPHGENDRAHSASLITQGQLLKHNYYSTTAANNREGVNSVTGRLYRQEEDPVLLGPLKARAYYVGDVEQTSIPLTPAAQQGLGFNVTNNPLQRIDFRTTDIRGNAIPGWDVELYRNGGLLGLVSVDDTGRYAFEGVELFAGDNDFELLFFGPQGEIRKEILEVPVNAEVLAQQGNVYEFAATLQERQTYRKLDLDDPDKDKLQLSGRYNFFTGNVLNYVGLRSVSVEGENKVYAAGGFTATWLKTLIDGFVAMDEDAEARAGLLARRNFGDLDVSLSAEAGTDEYSTIGAADPNVLTLSASAKQKIHFLPGRRNTLLADARYDESASGLAEENHGISLASQYGDINLSNALRYRAIENTAGPDLKNVNFVSNVRGRLGSNRLFWRVQSDYEIEPQKEFDEFLAELKYKHSDEWSSDFRVKHEPPKAFTEYRVGANWRHDQFMLSPFVEYDTENELFTGVNLRFAMLDDEDGILPRMTSQSVFGQGFVSAFVYLDKNGDLAFNGDDEPLPEVYVRSKNVSRRAVTDADGIAQLDPLPANYRTDIDIDLETLPEAFMISKYEKRSVSLKPGETIRLEMPVQYAGEIDGTVYLRRSSGEMRTLNRHAVQLLPLENSVNPVIDSEALYEGFFVFSLIPPGRYYLVSGAQDAAGEKARRPMPRLITVGYDAPVLYGQDVTLEDDMRDIGFGVLSEEEAYTIGLAPVLDRRVAQPSYFISLSKPDSSRLLSLLNIFGAQKHAAQHVRDLKTIVMRDPQNGKEKTLYFVPGNSLGQAYARCALIVDAGSNCRVEAALPPSENFVIGKQGIITTQNDIGAAQQGRI